MSVVKPPPAENAPFSNFIRQAIAEDNASGKWGGRVETRFPPEPNGYLHIGHAKALCVNFGLAAENGGECHLRFDDTNPEKESVEYENAIIEMIRWLGFDWGQHLYYASDYFEKLYAFAEYLIEHDKAYVDSQSAEDMAKNRGNFTTPGTNSPFRHRPIAESMQLFREMRAGKHAEGTHVLRAKIDMASPNMNMRDPALYRIRFAHHYRQGDKWCIYPMYDYAHPISDAMEKVTHSLCSLEFEDHRPLYDWCLQSLKEHLPNQTQQIEFARLNLSYTVMSKRKLLALVTDKLVSGWDDPRMPTLAGYRRRGYTPEAIRRFAEMIGVSKAHQWVDISVLEQCLRDDLEAKARRISAVIDPIKVVIENCAVGTKEPCVAAFHPSDDESAAKRTMHFTREVYIDRADFEEVPPKGYFRLSPGAEVRLRHAYIIKCERMEKDASGRVTTLFCTYDPATKSGSGGRNVKGNIHWVSYEEAVPVEVRLYDRLFTVEDPDKAEAGYQSVINPQSLITVQGFAEPAIATIAPGSQVQFERVGYFVADRVDDSPAKRVFNRAVDLKKAKF
jgi:glutaminyl-tRNA synthetase